jgi:hypothetical protein
MAKLLGNAPIALLSTAEGRIAGVMPDSVVPGRRRGGIDGNGRKGIRYNQRFNPMARKRTTHKTDAPVHAPRWNWRDIRLEWIAAALVMVALCWMVTEGDWNFFGTTGRLEGVYEAQAESLLDGRIDVAPEGIGDEAFVRNGKSYAYFGPTPALFRIPLVLLAPGMNGKWSRLSMMFGSALMLGAIVLLVRRLEEMLPDVARSRLWRWCPAALVLTAGLGSTQIFICAESKVYQESIQWASTLSLASAVCLLTYLMRPRTSWLALACAAGFLAFFARVSSGAGPIAALALLDGALLLRNERVREWFGIPEIAERRRAIAMLTATVAVTAALWMGINYWKFGVLFASQPMALNLQYNAERLRNIKGELASIHNVPLTLSSYLSPANVLFTRQFPWVGLISIPRAKLAARFPKAHFDYADWFTSLPAGMPALFFAAIAGAVLCLLPRGRQWRLMRVPLLGAIAGCGLALCWGLLAYRYLHDFFPWLVLGTAVALTGLTQIELPDWRRGLTGLLAAAAVYSMWANFAFGLVHQRLRTIPIQLEKRLAFIDLAAATQADGLSGLVTYATHWRGYLPAARVVDFKGIFIAPSDRSDSPVTRSEGEPPYAAAYRMTAPEEGVYELAIRCASTEARPMLLGVNGKVVGLVCEMATGGEGDGLAVWSFGGRHKLRPGPVDIRLASNTPLPSMSCLRLVRVD